MPRIPRALNIFKMALQGLYTRLLVTAGAVAFFVVNWLCRPARRQPSHNHQAEAIEAAPEQQALLEAEETENKDTDLRGSGDAAPDRARYEAPELSQLDVFGELREGAALAPDEVTIEEVQHVAISLNQPLERRIEEKILMQSRPSPAASSNPAEPPAHPKPIAVNPVDEAYLKSLIDKELGGPKFAVRKPAPVPGEQPDDRSLQELLEQSFGPPRFAIPKSTAALTASVDNSASGGIERLTQAPTWSRNADAALNVAAARGSPGAGGGVKRGAEELDHVFATAEKLENPVRPGSQGITVLSLSVTQGPASGKCAVADTPAGEYTIGRLPENWLQILDQEVSGRHAVVRWDSASGSWMLRDVGSLNGTALGGEPIGREYKVPGDERPLGNGDLVQLGSNTLLRAQLSTVRSGPVSSAVAAAAAKRHHGASYEGGSEILTGSIDQAIKETMVGGLPGLPPPGVLVDCPELGARLCVHNRLGADHKRLCQGCEDVPHWELPFLPYEGAGIVCIFDGHHGSKAANQAKEHLPTVLRVSLLRRDGRQTPALLPPPAPPPPRRPDGEDEEDFIETYDGSSSEEVLEEEPVERSGPEQAGTNTVGTGDPGAFSRCGSVDDDGGKDSILKNDGSSAVACSASAASGNGGPSDEATELQGAALEELKPPPPGGPPLPPLLRGRDIDSQRKLLRDTFLLTDKYMSMEEGCTATLIMLDANPVQEGWMLQSANVGDSSAVLVNFSRGTWCKLTEDHRIASSSSERQRLAAMGHVVRNRLYGLNISRMLGDRFLKEEDLGFLAEPYVSVAAQVGPSDHAVLVVASDGLWDVLPEERAATMLLQEAVRSSMVLPGPPSRHPGASFAASSANISSAGAGLAPPPAGVAAGLVSSPLPASGSFGCQAVADLLLTKALVMRSKDDITISVLELGPHLRSQHQQLAAAGAPMAPST
ncbi:hypothetical protein Vretimale_7674 [Volvox reticuliferus]|uniref:Uncharacterized protein n=1 Tax=Volvox reticuliferus TaxID=1737510 RepID=A0A8J4C9K7_9CHLO|nr:hypothetical protein Vretifemale_7765 [Volvox reticuliferus]GIM02845.1 hypothetical protein Vretimale_7674 [Volvox reticuliferus]